LWHAIAGTKPKIDGKTTRNHGFRAGKLRGGGQRPAVWRTHANERSSRRIVETIVALSHRDQRLIQYVAPPIVFHRRDPAPRIFGLHVLYELRSSFGGTIFSALTAFRPGHLYKFRERCESTPTNIFLLARNKSIGVVLCCGVNV
jgi:hypothetical protein